MNTDERGVEVHTERVEGIWRQIVDSVRGGILADWYVLPILSIICYSHARSTPAENLPLDVQEAEESFDLSLIAALEIDVVPYLGDLRVPDYIITQLATVLQRGSRIRDDQDYRPPSPASLDSKSNRESYDFEKIEKFGDVPAIEGTTDVGRFMSRERFSYWCFDLLFVICSDTANGRSPSLCSRNAILMRLLRPTWSTQEGGEPSSACPPGAM